ncbi:MAG: helix-turn-helix domain-containing protein [Kiritimatiellia bacterium]
MITQRIDELTYADIERLVEQRVPESRVLDYKRQLPGGTADEVKELLADVTSFANASGGHLVFGVTTVKENGKNTAIPEAIVGVGEINAEEVENRIDAQLRSCIQPRITGLRVKAIVETGKPTVFVIHIPRSWNAPHMVAKGSSKFYSRTSAGKQPLDVTEIRHAFAMSESVGERIRAFRDERIGRILAGETPEPLEDGALLVFHFFPLSGFTGSELLDAKSLYEQTSGILTFAQGGSRRHNFDGIVISSSQGTVPNDGYVQLFRNGAVEAVDTVYLRINNREGQPPSIPVFGFESASVDFCDSIYALQKRLGVAPPLCVFLSLLNVRGYALPIGLLRGKTLIERKHLLLPNLLVEDIEVNASSFLRPAFDMIWQAFGTNGSPSYDENGQWKKRG